MAKLKQNTEIITFKHDTECLTIIPLQPMTLAFARKYDGEFKLSIIENFHKIEIDLSKIEKFDSFAVVFINSIKKYCSEKNIRFEMTGAKKEFINYYNALSSEKGENAHPKPKLSFWNEYVKNIGKFALTVVRDFKEFVEFLGELIISMTKLLFNPANMRWRDFPFYFMRAGVNALPIILLIVFLIGVITGYQGALQLRQFGADIFIADLIGISITRELSPLMTAILIAGRSGSAFAAEIGTMKVSEEVDALQTMGFDIIKFLVLPRVFAVMLAAPILTMLANLAGILGGLIAAINTLNITMSGYFNEMQISLGYWDIFTGLGKSVVFGFLIATVGCFRGLQARGGAESVGNYTTASVVSGVLLIILSDAIFTFIFQSIGI